VLFATYVQDADEVTALFTDAVQFFHPGSNWEGVLCPVCGADAESWWEDAASAGSQRGFDTLLVTAECCGAQVSLNDLNYVWGAAFGRFALEAMNPNIRELSPDQALQLDNAVGHPLGKVWVHL
jgi:hypothetical protein